MSRNPIFAPVLVQVLLAVWELGVRAAAQMQLS